MGSQSGMQGKRAPEFLLVPEAGRRDFSERNTVGFGLERAPALISPAPPAAAQVIDSIAHSNLRDWRPSSTYRRQRAARRPRAGKEYFRAKVPTETPPQATHIPPAATRTRRRRIL